MRWSNINFLDEFLKLWIKFLMARDSRFYADVLIDAVRFSGGIQALSDFVRDYGSIRQTAYAELMNDYIAENRYEQAIAVANDGFEKLKSINSSRTKVADLLLEIGHSLNDDKLIKIPVITILYVSSTAIMVWLGGSYYKASAIVVSIAEIIRSKGDNPGATAFITGYKEKYPKHTAFHRCLREDIELTKFGRLF